MALLELTDVTRSVTRSSGTSPPRAMTVATRAGDAGAVEQGSVADARLLRFLVPTQEQLAQLAAALPPARAGEAEPLARSLLATVHGHCFFTINGTFRMLGETDPLAAALERVKDALR